MRVSCSAGGVCVYQQLFEQEKKSGCLVVVKLTFFVEDLWGATVGGVVGGIVKGAPEPCGGVLQVHVDGSRAVGI